MKTTILSIVAACLGVFTSTAFAQAPANDNFANAINLSGASGTVNCTNVNATSQANDPTAGNSIWYTWTAPQTSEVTFNTNGGGTLSDTVLYVYTGSAINALNLVGSSDDEGDGNRSLLTFVATSGVTYRIAIIGFNGASGTFPLNYAQVPPSPGVLSFNFTQAFINEPDGPVTLTVVRTGGSAGTVSAQYITSNETALFGSDYTQTSGTVSFLAGETSKTFTVPISNDTQVEDTETFLVTLSAPTGGATLGSNQATTVFIYSEDAPANDNFANAQVIAGPTGSVSGVDYSATSEGQLEDDNGAVVWYSWTAPITGVVQFSVPDDTGHFVDIFRGTTYGNKVSLTGATTAPNPAVPALLVPKVVASVTAGTIYRIAVGGGNAAFTLSWQATTNGILSLTGGRRFFDVNFGVDGEHFVADEKGGPITVKVRRTGGLDGVVSATYQVRADTDDEFGLTNATAGADFTAATGTVTFQPGEAEKTFSVAITNDTTAEDNEDFVIRLSNPTGGAFLGTTVAQVHIFDDENDPANDDFANAQPIFGTAGSIFGDNSYADVESTEPPFSAGVAGVVDNLGASIWYRWTPPASGIAEFSALINGDSQAEAIDVYTTGVGGLQLVTHGGLVFDQGFNGVFTRTVFNAEAGQVYYIRLDGSSAYGSLGATELTWNTITGGIINFAAQSFEVTEGAGAAYQVVIQRAGGLTNGASVVLSVTDNSAEGLVDYTPVETTVVFNPGETTKTVSIPILNDSETEGDELFDVSLLDPSGAILGDITSASVTIFDDEDDPANDLFIARIALGASGTQSGTTEGAGPEAGEPDHGRFSVWYRWTSPIGNAGVATFSLNGSSSMAGSTVTIYTGTTLNGLTKVVQGYEEVSFLTTPNTTYAIAITDRGGDDGSGVIYFSPSTFDLTYGFDASGSVISFTNASLSVAETASTLTVSLTRSGSTTGTATVDFNLLDLTTLADEDYVLAPDVVTFAAGQATKTFTISILNDTIKEGDETFTISLANPINAVLAPGNGQSATVTILDDDDDIVPPSNDNFAAAVLLAGSNPIVSGFTEGATVEVNEPMVAGVLPSHSVWYKWVAPGNGAAHLSLNTATHFASAYTGTTLANLTEVTFASAGAFSVTSGTTYYVPVNATAGSNFDLTINFSAAGLFSFSPGSLAARENGGPAAVTIQRTNGTTGAASVRFRAESLTAQAGSDFQAVDTVVNFASGVASQIVNVPITNDTLEEGPETVRVTLSDPTGGAITAYGPDQVVTLVIQDDESSPPNDNLADAIALSGPFGTTFGSNTDGSVETGEPTHAGIGKGASLWYRWTAPANGTVTFRTSGSNIATVLAAYTGITANGLNLVASSAANPSAISFLATAGTSYALAVDSADGSRGEVTLSWSLLLPGVISFAPTSYAVNESAGTVTLTVARNVGSDGTVAVSFATANGTAVAGEDFAANTGTLTFGPGETSKTITVTITNDTVFESLESFTVTLSAPTNGAALEFATATVNVTSNDAFVANAVDFAALVNPGGTHAGSGLLTMRLASTAGFSGKLTLGGKESKFTGAFDSFGKALVTIPTKKNIPGVSVELQITDGGKAIVGRAYNAAFDSIISGDASFYDKKTNLYPGAGLYTMAISPTAAGATLPQGIGTSSVLVTPAGLITIKKCVLGDGSSDLKGTIGFIAQNGKAQFYKTLYKGGGSIAGVVTFRNEALTDADGTLSWFKPAGVAKTLFGPGFTTSVAFEASKYLAPAKDTRIDTAFNSNNGSTTVVLTSGGLATPVTIVSPLTTGNTINATAPIAFNLASKFKEGTFSGKLPVAGTETKFNGVFLQKGNKAVGQFLGTALSGSVVITPTP